MAAGEIGNTALFRFGWCAERAGQLELARVALERSRRLHTLAIDGGASFQGLSPVYAVLSRFHLARVLEKLGRRDEARAEVEAFLRHWGQADRPLEQVTEARALARRLGAPP